MPSARKVSSLTAMTSASAEFLIRAMNTLPRGATTVRKAWGSTTTPSTCWNVNPSERAASAWPWATALMPDRTVSATNVPV